MSKSLISISLHHINLSVQKSLRTILLGFWLLNLLTSSFIYSKTYDLTETGDIPIHTLFDSDLTFPRKLFFIQNETLSINEILKVQPYHNLNIALLVKADFKLKFTAEIPSPADTIFLLYVFIETTNPRSPPTSLS
ncbi:MAG TPA: hypothetical protein VLH59_16665 [Ignavibacteriaceae bacterium]|nr:hypothetical protein [Ignavibacteriaceae bacterium]